MRDGVSRAAPCTVAFVPQPPTGTVTFLFTDIEGSTRLWEERPDDMRAALTRHDQLLRAAIDGNGGYVFATGGDGFAAAFGRAADAVAAAQQAQAGIAGLELVRVRMGINTGEVHERDGDYFGSPVNRAARSWSNAPSRMNPSAGTASTFRISSSMVISVAYSTRILPA